MTKFKISIFKVQGGPIVLLIYLFLTRYLEGFFYLILKYRLLKGKEDLARFHERKGIVKLKRPKGQLVWFNAASVGEVLSIFPLMKSLRKTNTNLNFLITSTTLTSAKLISDRLPQNCQHQFSPIDTLRATRAFLDHWKPDLGIFVEGELWPRLLLEAEEKKIPLGLINARMEIQSFENWMKINKTAKRILETFNFAFAQDESTAKRLLSLGMRRERLLGIFSLKEHADRLTFDPDELKRLKENFSERKIWVAASTHPGEEDILFRAQQILHSHDKRYLLILVPRHPERGYIITKNLNTAGRVIARRSTNDKISSDIEIYVADTLGELGLWYELSGIAFLGGSMIDVGGHNPYEACRFGSAIMHGSFVYNFQDIFDRLDYNGASILVEDFSDIVHKIKGLNQDEKAYKMGLKGMKTVNDLSNKSQQIVEKINSFI